jgi:thioredoxin 1
MSSKVSFLFVVFFSSVMAAQPYNDVDSKTFNNIISNSKGTLLDVRTQSEYSNGHIEGAGQLNYYALDFNQKLLMLSRNEPIYLYCNTGYRSKRAAIFLAEKGYTNVYNLQKGIMEWELLDYPVQVSPNAKRDARDAMESDEFNALILSNEPVFIDFYAPWCGPCRQMMPMIDSLKNSYRNNIKVVKINADASKKLIKELKIGSVPYLVMYKNGKILFDHYGLISRDLLVSEFEKHK